MVKEFIWCAVAALIGISLLVLPVSGSLYTIAQGDTAFIGEQGLDISQTGVDRYSKIGWYGPGTNGTSGEPVSVITVDDLNNFYIDPAFYTGKTGPWYSLPGNKLAFYVEDPVITLRIFDETAGFEVTGGATDVPAGDQVGFRIDTTLIAIANRPGISSVPVTIHVRQPNGNEMAELSGYKLIDIGVSASPFSTGPVWDTSTFPPGTYTIWADCNVNRMKDNYPVDGKTETPRTGNLQIVGTNPPVTPSLTRTPAVVATTTSPSLTVITDVTTAVPTTEQTATVVTTAPVTTEVPLPPETTKTPGPEFVLIVGGLGIAALLIRVKGSG